MLRARKAEEKEVRRRIILSAARQIWTAGVAFADFNMGEVAERAGLAKGTVYIYFATKEALLLELLREDLSEWLDVVDVRLDQGGVWTPRRVAQLIGDTLSERMVLARLLALMSSILEQNVPEDAAVTFKTWLRDRVLATGARMEKRLPFLREGEGARVLLFCHALVTGLQPMAEPPKVVAKLLERPDLKLFCVDFGKELSSSLWAFLLGLSEMADGRRS